MIYQLLINGGDAEKFWSAPPPAPQAKISLISWVFCGKFWSKISGCSLPSELTSFNTLVLSQSCPVLLNL